MTDGIIQKVFANKLMNIEQEIHRYINNADAIHTLEYHGQQLMKLQKELIEEIKKITYHQEDIPNCTCEHCFDLMTVIELLIGDNQE